MTLHQSIERSKKGDKLAQRMLFELTCGFLKGVALRYIADESAVDDILQETYIRIFKNVEKFNYVNDAATMGWMRQITAMESIRYIKKHKRWHELASEGTSSLGSQPTKAFEDEMYKMLKQLPIKQRIVFNMSAMEGYSHKEIAAHLEIAESSSRSLLTRARFYLQNQLKKNDSYEKV